MSSVKEIYKRIFGTDMIYPLLYILGASVIIFPFLFPLGLPAPIGEHATLMYQWIEDKVDPGDICVFMLTISGALYPENGYLAETNVAHVLNKGGSCIIVSTTVQASQSLELFLRVMIPELASKGYEYGEDWVVLSFSALAEEGQAALARDLHFGGSDYYGTSLGEIPLMGRAKTADDILGVFAYLGGSGGAYTLARTWLNPYPHLEMLQGQNACGAAHALTLWPHLSVCVINSISGSAQYMRLVGDLRFPVRTQDVLSTVHLFALSLIIVGNIYYHVYRKSGGQ
jgi:hypothetical protein